MSVGDILLFILKVIAALAILGGVVYGARFICQTIAELFSGRV